MKFAYFLSERRLRNLAGINLMVLTWSIGNGALWFLLPEITRNIGGSLLIAGLLVSFPSFISMVFDIPIGNLIDKVSVRKLLIVGFVLLVLTGLALPYAKTITLMLAFLFLIGILHEVIYVPALAYLITSTKKEVVSEYMGATMSAMHLGYALGPVSLGLILDYFHQSESYLTGLFFAAMCLISIAPTLLLRKDVKPQLEVIHVKRRLKVSRRLLKEVFNYHHLKSVGFTLLFTTFLLTSYDGMVWMLEPVYGFKLNLTPFYVGLLLTAFTLPLIIFQVPAGILADKYGRKKLMMLGLLTAGLFTIMFGFERNTFLMILYASIATVGLAMAWPAVDGLVAELNKKESTGIICGVWSSAKDLGYVFGPILGASIAYYLNSIGNAFIVMGVGIIASAIVINAFMKEH